MTIVVSGRFRASANDVKDVAVSPRPWSKSRMLGAGLMVVGFGDDVVVEWVIVTVRWEAKSDWLGAFVGIL